jgi:hypothetical protein
VTFNDNGNERSVYIDVNSGGSFGSNPLCQHIGIGLAKTVEKIEITWPVTGKMQLFQNLAVNTHYKIIEENDRLSTYNLAALDFKKRGPGLISCLPK